MTSQRTRRPCAFNLAAASIRQWIPCCAASNPRNTTTGSSARNPKVVRREARSSGVSTSGRNTLVLTPSGSACRRTLGGNRPRSELVALTVLVKMADGIRSIIRSIRCQKPNIFVLWRRKP